jgi:hypothetical protein
MPNYMRDDVPSSHSRPSPLRKLVIIFLLLIVVPIGISAGRYYWLGDHRGNWQTADRSSADFCLRHPAIPRRSFGYMLPGLCGGGAFLRFTPGSLSRNRVLRVTADMTTPPGVNQSEAMGLRRMAVGLERCPKRSPRLTATRRPALSRESVMSSRITRCWRLQPVAGTEFEYFCSGGARRRPRAQRGSSAHRNCKDYPYEGDWFGLTPSRTGVYASLGGYLGLTIGWIEGFEINFFGAVLGFDIRRPALKLPGIGRLGMTAGL